MELDVITNHGATITLSRTELITVNNALNEVCHALEIQEFETRMGATIEDVRELLNNINEVISRMELNG